MAPIAPHMTEDLYQLFSSKFKAQSSKFASIHTSEWPTFEENAIVHETINLAVQVNGKLRGVLVLNQNSPKDEKGIRDLAQKDPAVAKFLEGKSIKKVIYVASKILNFVVA
jgi:leucyl-tRNA synthetase